MASHVDGAEDAAQWPARAEELFIRLMVDEVNKGNMQTSIFHRKTWKSIDDELFKQLGKRYTVAKLKVKYNSLRKRYCEFAKLLNHTGFGWNLETNTIIAEEDTWQKYLKVNSYAKCFRNKGCDHYNLLGIIFNNSTATGVLHHASTQPPPTLDMEKELDEVFLNAGVYVNPIIGTHEDPYVMKYSNRDRVQSRSISAPIHHARKKSRSSRMESAIELVKAESYGSKSLSAEVSNFVTDPYSLEECMDVLEALEGVDSGAYFKACAMFKEPDWRTMFIKMSAVRKMQWLETLG